MPIHRYKCGLDQKKIHTDKQKSFYSETADADADASLSTLLLAFYYTINNIHEKITRFCLAESSAVQV